MGLMVQVIVLMLKICGFTTLLILQGSAGNAIAPSPATFNAISPVGEGTHGRVPHWKQVRGIVPSPASQPNGSSFHPSLVLPPLLSAPVPETTKGLTPLLSPSSPTLLPPNNSAAPPIQCIVPCLPLSASHGKPPHIEDHGLVPEAPVSVPLVPPSRKTPEYPPAIQPVMPGSMLVNPPQSKAPDNKSPLYMPIAPVQIAPPPREILQKPPASQPIVREVPPSNFPVPAASPPLNLLRHPPPIHPTVPEVPPSNLPVPATSPPSSNFPRYSPPMHPLVLEVPPSNLPEPEVSPISTPPPSFNWKRDGMPVIAPSNGLPKGLSPRAHSPAEAPVQNSPRDSANAPPPVSAISFPPHGGLHPPTPLPSTSFYKHHHAKKNITSPAPSSYLVPPPASTDKGPFITPPPSYPPNLDPKSKPKHNAPQILNPVPLSHSPISSPESPFSPAAPAQATPSQHTKKPEVSPISTPPPSFNWKRDGMPVVAPSNGMPKGLSPRAHSLAEAPVQNTPRDSANAPPPVSAINFPPHAGLHPPTPLPSTSFYKHHHARKNIISPAPSSYLVPPRASTDKGPFITQPPSYPPKLDPKSKPKHHAPQVLNPVPLSHSPISSPGSPLSPAAPARATPSQQTKKPEISPISTPPPSFNWKREGMPVVAPSNGMPKGLSLQAHSPAKVPVENSPRYSANAPPLVSAINFPPHAGLHPPSPLHSNSFYKHHQARKNITSPTSSSYLVPPASTDQGPFITPPSYPPKLDPKSKSKHHAPQILNPVSLSHSPISSPESPLSPASPAQATPSQQTKMPFLPPKISPSGSPPRNPKMPHLPHIQALPPPPPNEDCTSFSCTEPYTNTPPGSPCGCVLPIQVGLRLSVALYTFFPLVSELATEITVGVFMKQSQVRIMGANAASQDPEKTIVLIDLVPLGETFDNTTASLTYQRFWHKQVAISTYFFGDYEVLYVRYPGLPSSPPSVPLSIDGVPSAGHDGKGKPIKPLGVDVRRQQHKDGLKGSVIAIIVLSASIILILCCAVAWVLLFRRTDRNSHPEQTPPTMLPSLAKSSGIAASVIGSGPSSISLSYNSSIAPYTGTAKTYSSSDIERATDNFDASRILGEGGFGLVYSGVLEDGTKVAVKVLKRDDQQGGREFLAEVEMLSRLHHRNLVRLIGICTEERARCLVYELIPNGSVESHLHGVDKEDAPLDWGARLKIALGAARGLAYLHEDSSPRVIHRDFKSSNILLEHDFTPKVSDFGLARTALDEENRHITTRVMGTFGYVAPEYAMTGHLLVKSDVYSYGVVLLELLTGRKPVDMSQPPGQENLVTWARPLLTSKEGLELMTDQSLGPDFPFDSIAKVAAIASMCVQPEVSHRPFMGEVVQALKLVCNECDATRDLGSRSCSQENLSVDFDARLSSNSGHLPDPLQMQSPLFDYVSALDVERGLPPVSELFSASARLGRTDSWSFRRHSSSGPLRSARVLPLWQRMRRLSGGSLSEDGVMFRSWPGSH